MDIIGGHSSTYNAIISTTVPMNKKVMTVSKLHSQTLSKKWYDFYYTIINVYSNSL